MLDVLNGTVDGLLVSQRSNTDIETNPEHYKSCGSKDLNIEKVHDSVAEEPVSNCWVFNGRPGSSCPGVSVFRADKLGHGIHAVLNTVCNDDSCAIAFLGEDRREIVTVSEPIQYEIYLIQV